MTPAVPLPDSLVLSRGFHRSREEGTSLLEAAAWHAGEGHTSHPRSVSWFLTMLGHELNDRLDDATRQSLKRFISVLVTTGDDRHDMIREWMALDWMVRVRAPAWAQCAGLCEYAEQIRQLPPVHDGSTLDAALPLLHRVRDASWAEHEEAWRRLRAAASEDAVVSDVAGYAFFLTAYKAARNPDDVVEDTTSGARILHFIIRDLFRITADEVTCAADEATYAIRRGFPRRTELGQQAVLTARASAREVEDQMKASVIELYGRMAAA